jgi:hypothetical protein
MPSATIQHHLERNGSSVDAGSNDGVAIVRDMRSLHVEGLNDAACALACQSGYEFLRVFDEPTNL